MFKIKDIIQCGENDQIEFKEHFGKSVIETITSFSNTDGGVIIIGISDNKDIVGCAVTEETIKNWVNEIKQTTMPQQFPDIKIIEYHARELVVINVQEFPVKPVAYKGRYYKRVGASNHTIPVEEIVSLQLSSLNNSFDAVAVDVSPDQLNMEMVAAFFNDLKNRGRINLSEDNQTNLIKLGLVHQNKVTLGANLLFGDHNTAIHIGRFKTPDTIIDDELIKTPLTIALDQAMLFIKKNIRLQYDIADDLQRKEKWQYPLPVIRELLLNCVVHRDYRNPTDIIIKIFDNKIVFTNPGQLMGGLKIEDLNTDDYIAVHRNKLLAESFYLRGDVEKYGTGFIRIRKHLQESSQIDLNIQQLGDFIQVILTDNSQTMQDTMQDTMQVSQQEIDLLSKMNNKHTREELQGLLNINNRDYFRVAYLKPALGHGLISMTIPEKPTSKNQKYFVSTKGEKLFKQLAQGKR